MQRRCVLLALLFLLALSSWMTADARQKPQAQPSLDGTWVWKGSGQGAGTMILHQEGSAANGIWHTVNSNSVNSGKPDPDSTVSAMIDGNNVTLIRTVGSARHQYALTMAPGGNHIQGFGDSPSFHHADLAMDRLEQKADDSVIKMDAAQLNQKYGGGGGGELPWFLKGDLRTLGALAVFPAAMVLFFCIGEFSRASISGWSKLALRYPNTGLIGDCNPCWLMQCYRTEGRRAYSATLGKGKFLVPIKLGIPPAWVGASSQGLTLKRNFWNFRHPPLLIPWDKIVNAEEVSSAEMANRAFSKVAGPSPYARPFDENGLMNKAATLIGGTMCEIRLSDPEMVIYIQMEAAQSIVRVLGPKFKFRGGR